jgi:ABC-type transport system substrate-binding protein
MCFRLCTFVLAVLLTLPLAFIGTATTLRVLVPDEAKMLELAESLVFEPLVTIDQDGMISPCLADSWEADTAQTAWTFHIRSGVVFHDGQPLLAQHVADSLAAALAPVAETVALDSQTLAIYLREPTPLLLRELTALPVFRNAAADWAGAEIAAVGTGPYTLARREAGECVLEPCLSSWRATTGATLYDRIDALVEDNPAVRRLLVQDGSADVALGVSAADVLQTVEPARPAAEWGHTALALEFNLQSRGFRSPPCARRCQM